MIDGGKLDEILKAQAGLPGLPDSLQDIESEVGLAKDMCSPSFMSLRQKLSFREDCAYIYRESKLLLCLEDLI